MAFAATISRLVDRCARARLRDRCEVDVVERVQELRSKLEVRVTDERDSLDRAEIERDDLRARHIVIPRGAIATHDLDTIRAIRRRKVATARCTE